MIQLTKEQHDELVKSEVGAKVMDPLSNTEYVLIRADQFERLRSLLDDDFRVSDAYAAIDEAFAENWNAPGMSDYDRYEDFKK